MLRANYSSLIISSYYARTVGCAKSVLRCVLVARKCSSNVLSRTLVTDAFSYDYFVRAKWTSTAADHATT